MATAASIAAAATAAAAAAAAVLSLVHNDWIVVGKCQLAFGPTSFSRLPSPKPNPITNDGVKDTSLKAKAKAKTKGFKIALPVVV